MAPPTQFDIWRQRLRSPCTLAISSTPRLGNPLVLGDGLQHEDVVRRSKEGLPPAPTDQPKSECRIDTTLTIANYDNFDSYVELTLKLPVEHDQQAADSSTITIQFNRDSIRTVDNEPSFVECRRINMNNADEIKSLFGFGDEALQSYINAAGLYLPRQAVFLVSVPFAPHPPSRNLMINRGFHGPVSKDFARLQQSFRKSGTVHALFTAYVPFPNIDLLNSKISEYRAQDPLAKFYGDIGFMKPKSSRPQIAIERQFLFPTWRHYRTILECALMEELEVVNERSGVRLGAMRLVPIPHSGDTQFFGFLDLVTAAEKLREGDALRVCINATEEAEYYRSASAWNATVIPQIPFAPSNSTSVILKREFSEEDEVHDRQQVSCICVDTSKSIKDSKAALQSAVPVPVVYALETDTEASARLIRSLHRLEDPENSRWAHAALLGHRIMFEPTIDMFKGIKHNKVASRTMELAMSRLNSKQASALQMTRSLPSGIGIVQGPPGTGKTYMISNLVQPLIWSTAPHKGPRVLILSTSNLSVDDLTERVQSTCTEFATELSLKRKPVVLRVHSSDTESRIVRDEADLTALLPSRWDSDQSSVAKALSNAYNRAHQKPFGIEDKRLRLIDSSLGKFMLKIALMQDSELTGEEKRVVWSFRAFYFQYKSGTLGKDQIESFERAQNALRDVALARADVLVMTLSNSSSSGIRRAIKPKAIIVDEAARASDPELLSVFAWYMKDTARLIVGDSQQLQPVAEHKNPMRDQLTLSALARLKSLGYPHVQLCEQRRSAPAIMDVYSKAYYEGSLTTCAEFDTKFHPQLEVFKKFLREKHSITTPQSASLFQLGCGTSSLDASGSWYNQSNARVTMQAVVDLLSYGIEASCIAILAPYAAQTSLYLAAKTQLSEHRSGIAALNVETFDSIQGREFDYTIVDFVRTDGLGFLSEGNRVNVALSRARFGMIVVMRYDRLSISKGWGSSGLQTAMSVLKENGDCNPSFNEQDVEKMITLESV